MTEQLLDPEENRDSSVPPKGKTILITGGAGFLGSVLVQKIIDGIKGWTALDWGMRVGDNPGHGPNPWAFPVNKIIVYDSLLYKQTPLTNYCYRGDFEFVHGDVRNHAKLLPYIQEADVVFPLAAIVGAPACDKDPVMAEAVNYEHIKFILANRKKYSKIIYPNTNSGYGIGEDGIHCTEKSPLNPISLYGITKCKAEATVLEEGGISLRLATVFGVSPRLRLDLLVNDFVYKAIKDQYIILFEAQFKRNYIHIHDVALTFIYAMQNYYKMFGQAYNVGLSSANLSKLELAEKVKKYLPNFVIKEENFTKDIDQRNYIVSNDKLESTGWKPYYSLDDGIKELIHAYKIVIPSNNLYTNL